MSDQQSKPRYVVCLENKGYPASLEKRKIYRALPDAEAAERDLLRVIDESGEDYLYPASFFAPLTLSETIAEALAATE